MQKLDSLNQVAEFHNTFGAPILPNPMIPSPERCALRVSLLAEELDELREAIAANDLVEIADALCDLQYVLSGAVLEFGMGERFVDLFNEVQRSNMSKACQSLEEAEYTVKFYQDKDGTEAEIKEENGLWKVYRKSDNKVLKSINYSPADLVSLLK
ncbi:nucleoside triphosphate pyrophosphohydrolase family protein [Aquirufa regiilacus]|uniref:Nucleoside triphosphate pyrophosphohydrolase family protein n=1 Tax=Aquirufa regiilacus TaxID=3024868 RepID=A0ABU3TQN6_9BACT|nr:MULTISPECIES: nucleoside triphosphate pyrophosphohydrolase family protein [unclassified Aquirufa]MDT8887339.1 nucleoside triphosphate pyrophosphohydrolase family protein [Aquirufa sp. LEPPI-3A]MDU0807987.1 nucleoside triphosphate pyrophosphohydrolase family protein [Aquirufa sp. LEOWEIH-7C]